MEFIQKKISKNLIPNFFCFKKVDYLKSKQIILNKINKKNNNNIILRSSALDEDGKTLSNAGKYDSFVVKKKKL